MIMTYLIHNFSICQAMKGDLRCIEKKIGGYDCHGHDDDDDGGHYVEMMYGQPKKKKEREKTQF